MRETVLPTTNNVPLEGREKKEEDERAAEDLTLGEFDGVQSMSTSDVRLLLERFSEHRKANAHLRPIPEEREITRKALDYVQEFSRFKNEDNVVAVGRAAGAVKILENFERSQLATLVCETAEEARALIPSLGKKIDESPARVARAMRENETGKAIDLKDVAFEDGDLQDLLDEITALKELIQ